jgi:hypothetical protein
MWLDELDVARRLETLERQLSDEEPALVQSFRALSHPSLRAHEVHGAATPQLAGARHDVVVLASFCAMLLIAIGLLTGSWAALLSAISLTVATLAVVGVLALLSDVFPSPGGRFRSRPR